MSPRLDVLTVGELNPDLILSGLLSPAPVLGTEQFFDRATLVLGSSAAIATVLMARLSLRTALVSRVGDDEYGRFCLARFAEDGVDASLVTIDPEVPTGLTISLAYPADRLLLTAPGTMATMSCANIPAAAVGAARHLHASSVFLQPALRPALPDIFKAARQAGLTTSLDTGFDPGGRWMDASLKSLLAYVDMLLPNEVELRALSGQSDPVEASRTLLDLGVKRVCAKLGRAGGLVIRADHVVSCGSFAVEARDTTGAGDAFNAGMICGHLTGLDDAASLRLATACGAMTASAIGGTGGFRTRSEVDAFMAARPKEAKSELQAGDR